MTECFIREIADRLWTFPIELPHSPLWYLNCYVILGYPGQRNLLVDTGFGQPECRRDLLAAMEYLKLEPENTDVFLTHFHPDHAGNADFLESLGCKIYIGERDTIMFTEMGETMSVRNRERYLHDGLTQEHWHTIHARNPEMIAYNIHFAVNPVAEGTVFSTGGYHFQCISTPGHSIGHMCLYDREKEIMMLGDHVLFDISPNISSWIESEDILGEFLNSLRKIKEYPVAMALPAHGLVSRNLPLSFRVDQLLMHHRNRLKETLSTLAEDGLNAAEITRRLSWKGLDFSRGEVPASQYYFALSETLAHLDHLCAQGEIRREAAEPYYRYYKTKS